MTYLKNKIKEDFNKGKRVETIFSEILDQFNCNHIMSTRSQDALEGWDMLVCGTEGRLEFLENKYIDIKGVKSEHDDINWVELLAYDAQGNTKLGWLLRGKAEFIAFERKENFIIVEKAKLRNLIYRVQPILQDLKQEAVETNERAVKKQFEWYFKRKLEIARDDLTLPVILDRDKKDDCPQYGFYSRIRQGSPDLICKIHTSDLLDLMSDMVRKI